MQSQWRQWLLAVNLDVVHYIYYVPIWKKKKKKTDKVPFHILDTFGQLCVETLGRVRLSRSRFPSSAENY